jgi:hypothetical protein
MSFIAEERNEARSDARCWRLDVEAVIRARCFRALPSARERAFLPRCFRSALSSVHDASLEVPQAADFELFEVVRPERFELPAY